MLINKARQARGLAIMLFIWVLITVLFSAFQLSILGIKQVFMAVPGISNIISASESFAFITFIWGFIIVGFIWNLVSFMIQSGIFGFQFDPTTILMYLFVPFSSVSLYEQSFLSIFGYDKQK